MSHIKKGDKWLAKVIGQAETEYLSKLEQEELEKSRKLRNRQSAKQFVLFVLFVGLAGGFLFQQEITTALGIEAEAEEYTEGEADTRGEMVPSGSKGMLAALDESIAAENGVGGKKGKKQKFAKIKQSFERIEYASSQAEKRANILNEIEEEMGME